MNILFKIILLISMSLINSSIFSYTFSEAVELIKKHDSVVALENKHKAIVEEAESKGSWGDPMFRVAAKNYPKDSLKSDSSPMTGIEFGVSQKISLTTKYGNMEDAVKAMGKSAELEANDRVQELLKFFWEVVIENNKLEEELEIIKENSAWLDNILKISKKLYANGKISQQALLDIQIRKSEVDTSMSNSSFEYQKQKIKLSFLLGKSENDKLNKSTIPWSYLKKKSSEIKDFKELGIKSMVLGKSKMLLAKKQSYIPDVTVSLGYTKRSNIDNKGDFVSAMVSFPLPFSSQKYADVSQAFYEKASVEKMLENYTKKKDSDVSSLKLQIEKLENEVKILKDRTIVYAKNSRDVTSKSYRLGSSTYVELLQSEMKLQNLLMKKVMLNAALLNANVNLKYITGEKLYE